MRFTTKITLVRRDPEPPGHHLCSAGPAQVDQVAAGVSRWGWNRRHHYLLVRPSRSDGKLAFYRCWSPRQVRLRELVAVAGRRWSIETCFQAGKGLGLDEHQVRGWGSWYRHTTLVMPAHALLTVNATH